MGNALAKFSDLAAMFLRGTTLNTRGVCTVYLISVEGHRSEDFFVDVIISQSKPCFRGLIAVTVQLATIRHRSGYILP